MKKVLALLILALATLPSLALSTRRVEYGGYRIGDSAVLTNETRVSDCPFSVTDASQDPGKSLSAEKVNGQKIVRWWSYGSITQVPATHTVPAHIQYNNVVTNFLAVYSPTWSYNTVSSNLVYLVVDYDYITYTLSYNANGGSGSLPSSRSNVIYTNEVMVASDSLPARTGYTWSGWTNNLSTTVWLGGEKVTGESLGLRSIVDGSNVVLRAQWTANEYTVTFNANGGSVSPASKTVTYDSTYGDLPMPTRAGHRFDGWYTAESGGSAIAATATYKTAGDSTVYAHWVKQVTATFKDGYSGEVLKSETLDTGGTPTAPEVPEHTGRYSTGWQPAVGAISVDTTFTMGYAPSTYIVVFHADNGTATTATQQFAYDASATSLNPVSSLTGFSLIGYAFQNWTNATGTVYVDGQQVSNLAQSGEYHLFAVWTPISYAIEFDGEDAEADPIDAKYDTVYSLPRNGFVKPGFDFKGWRFGGATYAVGASVSNLATTAGAKVTFSAIWSELRYAAFDGHGADNAEAMIDDVLTFDGVETHALVSNRFEKTGYTFGGWATNETEAAAQTVAYTDGADVASTNLWRAIGETNVFYAVWSNNHYTVHFDANGGTGTMADMALTYDVETNLAIHTFTHASGLSFAGWTNYTDSVGYDDGATVSNLTAEADGEVTLFAVWDVGELSKAMHCNNLEWTSEGSAGTYAGWTKAEGDGIGYDSNSAAVSVLTDEDRTQPLKAEVTTGGKLSFKFKVVGDANITWTNANSSVTYSGLNAGTWYSETLEIAAPMEGEAKEIFLQYVLSGSAADTVRVYIDQMTWAPAGAEPTEADRPVVSGFTPATDGGFTLSVDPANISDSFRYQILATNELVSGEWPVKADLTAAGLKAGYAITPEAGEPTMFYKVKVIAK